MELPPDLATRLRGFGSLPTGWYVGDHGPEGGPVPATTLGHLERFLCALLREFGADERLELDPTPEGSVDVLLTRRSAWITVHEDGLGHCFFGDNGRQAHFHVPDAASVDLVLALLRRET